MILFMNKVKTNEKNSSVLTRIISGVIGALILFGVYLLKNDIVFNIAVVIIAIIGLNEFYHAVRQKGIKPIEWIRIYLLFTYGTYTVLLVMRSF